MPMRGYLGNAQKERLPVARSDKARGREGCGTMRCGSHLKYQQQTSRQPEHGVERFGAPPGRKVHSIHPQDSTCHP